MMKNELVLVVFDERERRPRVQHVGTGAWIRFPKALRQVGALFEVEKLKPLPGGSFNASGKIRRVA